MPTPSFHPVAAAPAAFAVFTESPKLFRAKLHFNMGPSDSAVGAMWEAGTPQFYSVLVALALVLASLCRAAMDKGAAQARSAYSAFDQANRRPLNEALGPMAADERVQHLQQELGLTERQVARLCEENNLPSEHLDMHTSMILRMMWDNVPAAQKEALGGKPEGSRKSREEGQEEQGRNGSPCPPHSTPKAHEPDADAGAGAGPASSSTSATGSTATGSTATGSSAAGSSATGSTATGSTATGSTAEAAIGGGGGLAPDGAGNKGDLTEAKQSVELQAAANVEVAAPPAAGNPCRTQSDGAPLHLAEAADPAVTARAKAGSTVETSGAVVAEPTKRRGRSKSPRRRKERSRSHSPQRDGPGDSAQGYIAAHDRDPRRRAPSQVDSAADGVALGTPSAVTNRNSALAVCAWDRSDLPSLCKHGSAAEIASWIDAYGTEDLDATNGAGGLSPLMIACHRGSVDVAKLLLVHGADVNQPSAPDRFTPLMFAVMAGSEAVVKLLLRNDAQRSRTNRRSDTAATLGGFLGQHACVAIVKTYLNLEVFQAFAMERYPDGDLAPCCISEKTSKWLFVIANQTDMRPENLWNLVHSFATSDTGIKITMAPACPPPPPPPHTHLPSPHLPTVVVCNISRLRRGRQ